MAIFGPQAKLERCLWWAELRSWPNGASDSRKANCYDKIFGRESAPSALPKGALGKSETAPVKPKNDLLTLALVIGGGFLFFKYTIKK
jgi:hypothetical protein